MEGPYSILAPVHVELLVRRSPRGPGDLKTQWHLGSIGWGLDLGSRTSGCGGRGLRA